MNAPIDLIVPAGETAATGLSVAAWVQIAMLAAAVLTGLVLVGVRVTRPRPQHEVDTLGFQRAAKKMRIGVEERETLAAMGAASEIEPAALLFSERALRRARIAALAAGDEDGELASARVKKACLALGVE